MNNRFIQILIIINGILIPIFILFLIGSFIISELKTTNRNGWGEQEYENKMNEYEIDYSSPKKIPNSDNYFVAVTKTYLDEFILDTGDNNLNLIPSHTKNIIFLDNEFNVKGKLLEKEGSIQNMFVPNSNDNKKSDNFKVERISFFIAKEDTNNDDRIDELDDHFVFISDLNGKNLKKVTDKKVKKFQWINENKELLLTFANKNDSLEYGVYNINLDTITQTKSLNNGK